MEAQVLDRSQSIFREGQCQHYWVLESPSGEFSRGVCKYCGKARGFKNATQDFVWEEERAADMAFWSTGDVPKLLESSDLNM
ncbi:MAG: hypothetical protein HYY02_06315 [Chloroflexi bacterium]|nr:hypothetical protein [Chloroflexota bacterium]